MEVRITCIKRDDGSVHDHDHAIDFYGWQNELTNKRALADRQAMVNWVKQPGNAAYVKNNFQQKVYCKVNTSRNGIEFLQTYSNGMFTDNLLHLPEC